MTSKEPDMSAGEESDVNWREQVCTNAATGEPAEPHWSREVPLCDEDCRYYDGKRCELQGFRPGTLCEPVVREMAVMLTQLVRGRGE